MISEGKGGNSLEYLVVFPASKGKLYKEKNASFEVNSFPLDKTNFKKGLRVVGSDRKYQKCSFHKKNNN